VASVLIPSRTRIYVNEYYAATTGAASPAGRCPTSRCTTDTFAVTPAPTWKRIQSLCANTVIEMHTPD
jgi:hypothetical protein